MARLCERPGCSENAAVAYGMRAEDLVFWLDVLGEEPSTDAGVLCLRHANSMVVPRGWTLDDLREPDLRLFRPPVGSDQTARRHRRESRRPRAAGEQLELGVDDPGHDAGEILVDLGAPDDRPVEVATAGDVDPASTDDAPWVPDFDSNDDLGGLLSARSPLLARAFRGHDRPR